MFNLLFSLGWGTLSYTREKAEKIVEEMVDRGDLRREEAKKFLNELIERGEEERSEFKNYLHGEFANWMQKHQLVSREEYNKLEKRIYALEAALEEKEY